MHGGVTDETRRILDEVAAGSLTPEEAQRLLSGEAPGDTADAGPAVARIAVRGSAVKLTIVADPEVESAEATGPHRIERSGDQLMILSDLYDDRGATEAPRSSFMKWVDASSRAGSTLAVRVNPFLPLDVLTVAGSLELSGVRAPVSVGVEAGSAKLGPGSGPLQLSVSSGAAEVDWLFVGESTIRAELGSAKVAVLPGSDVSITVDSSAGSASIIGPVTGAPATGNATSATVGAGTGQLTANARMGSVVVRIVDQQNNVE